MMTQPKPGKPEDCTSIQVENGYRCCYVYYKMKDDEYDVDEEMYKCNAIEFKKKYVVKYNQANEDFDDYELQCSALFIKSSIGIYILFLFIFLLL